MKNKLTMLMVLDGFGRNESKNANAVKLADTPNIDKLMRTWPTTLIKTSGLDVGLPEGQMGNSEVRTYEHWSRKNCISRLNKNYKIN